MGSADKFALGVIRIGAYVLVASSDGTISPYVAGTDVLKVYGGVVKDGVAKT